MIKGQVDKRTSEKRISEKRMRENGGKMEMAASKFWLRRNRN